MTKTVKSSDAKTPKDKAAETTIYQLAMMENVEKSMSKFEEQDDRERLAEFFELMTEAGIEDVTVEYVGSQKEYSIEAPWVSVGHQMTHLNTLFKHKLSHKLSVLGVEEWVAWLTTLVDTYVNGELEEYWYHGLGHYGSVRFNAPSETMIIEDSERVESTVDRAYEYTL